MDAQQLCDHFRDMAEWASNETENQTFMAGVKMGYESAARLVEAFLITRQPERRKSNGTLA